jgi:glycosyltransferase involved in cell wall biosynthesis
MILAYDGSSLAQGLSGVGYYTRRLLEELAARALDGRLAAPVVLSNRPVPVPEGSRLYEHHRFPVRAVWMEAFVPRALSAVAADVAHFTNYTAPLRLDLPYVVTVHDMSLALLPECSTWKMRLIVPRVLPRVARRARLVLVPSHATRDDVVRLLGVDPGRVRVIPHAAPRSFADTADATEGGEAPYFLFVGNLSRARTSRAPCAPSRGSRRRCPLIASWSSDGPVGSTTTCWPRPRARSSPDASSFAAMSARTSCPPSTAVRPRSCTRACTRASGYR